MTESNELSKMNNNENLEISNDSSLSNQPSVKKKLRKEVSVLNMVVNPYHNSIDVKNFSPTLYLDKKAPHGLNLEYAKRMNKEYRGYKKSGQRDERNKVATQIFLLQYQKYAIKRLKRELALAKAQNNERSISFAEGRIKGVKVARDKQLEDISSALGVAKKKLKKLPLRVEPKAEIKEIMAVLKVSEKKAKKLKNDSENLISGKNKK